MSRDVQTEPLKVAGEQTIRTVGELHGILTGHLAQGGDVVVDLSGVELCDAAGLQLIYALSQSAVERNQRFQITAVSNAITETSAALGLRLEGLDGRL